MERVKAKVEITRVVDGTVVKRHDGALKGWKSYFEELMRQQERTE